MKIAYFDCFSGISGDMVLGALVDAGADIGALEAELRRLKLDGWKISAEKVKRGAILATKVNVEAQEHHHHRHLSGILKMIDDAGLAPRAKERARNIFQRLGEAEAKVHNIPIEKVHFHEVGAVDSIVDIVGAAIGFELLGIAEFACSILDVGAGKVKTEHGLLPVPAPATAELLRDAPTFSSGIEKELVTPTGAAIATTLATRFAEMPAMKLTAIGYGAGSADLKEQPNVLRLMIGESLERGAAESADAPVAVIEANLDDMSPQIYGYFVERALEAGALDVFSTPVQMKKNRPGQLVTLLCEAGSRDRLIDLVFHETTTIGVRTYEVQRRTLARESVAVETPLGNIRMKISRLNGTVLNASPEYEDCQRIATQKNVPLKQVLATANFYFQKRSETAK
ncbi:MAG TPA: nickel pincer cofactor biosynthesis protein LarC [Candidatus Acidoferrales bacterium]|nr:nickel pincer cofactor biosynthesis protein LarC [Candidatus Acidoferrales bacterium]